MPDRRKDNEIGLTGKNPFAKGRVPCPRDGGMITPCHWGCGDYFLSRVFLPVGQGAFYCERFYGPCTSKPFTLVYDCGVSFLTGPREQKGLQVNFKSILNTHFSEGLKTINVLFISHLDLDHINGLRLLREFGVKIKKFFLPGIEDEDRWLMDLWFETMEPDGLAWGIFRDPSILSVMFPGAEVVVVPSSSPSMGGEESREGEGNPNPIKLAELVPSFANTPFHDWVFSPFNLRRGEYINILQKRLAEVLHLSDPVTNEKLRKQWEEKGQDILEDVIRGVYAEKGILPRNGPTSIFNSNSMTLYSGPASKAVQTCDVFLCQTQEEANDEEYDLKFHSACLPQGCLYTGDYDAKTNIKALWAEYTAYLHNIGCVQIPHHGSINSFNDELLKRKAIFVVSAGLQNQRRHPHKEVRDAFQKNGKKLYCVTEDPKSCLCIGVCSDRKSISKEAEFDFFCKGKQICILGSNNL